MPTATLDPKSFVATLDAILDKAENLAGLTATTIDDKIIGEAKAIVDSAYFLTLLVLGENILESGASTGAPTARLFGPGGILHPTQPLVATPGTPGTPTVPATPTAPVSPAFGQPGHPFLVSLGKWAIQNLPAILGLFGVTLPPGLGTILTTLPKLPTATPTSREDHATLARVGAVMFGIDPNTLTQEQLGLA